ncbi:hypothetical protein ACH5RR_032234 [Cinchona calisaya]|uniref:Reverse transcriptase n=1 Tax=Cinchona calisaya TaxID=153742 RepID=A0ABD2YLW5_9GENT
MDVDKETGLAHAAESHMLSEPATTGRKAWWEKFTNLRRHVPDPWLCIGDFNEVLFGKEFVGFLGAPYTWFRGQKTEMATWGRLDRARGNPCWTTIFPYFIVHHLVSHKFDYLTKCAMEVIKCDRIHGVSLAHNTPSISHLLFANDTLLFENATKEEVLFIKQLIELYGATSGQFEKSAVVFIRGTLAEAIAKICEQLAI